MARTIIVGDVHGCSDELDRLLDHVGFARGDQLVMVGDLVARGPDPCGTLEILRRVGAWSVRGNHEDKLLRWRKAKSNGQSMPLGAIHRDVARDLKKRDWNYLKKLPLWIDLPEHGLRVVHAGVVPGFPIQQQDQRTLMYIRYIGRFGEALESREGGRVLWGQHYDGPPHIVFGHNAHPEPQIHPWATGIDTGAVYGGRLTAMVLRPFEQPPPPLRRRDVLVSVPARRAYFDR